MKNVKNDRFSPLLRASRPGNVQASSQNMKIAPTDFPLRHWVFASYILLHYCCPLHEIMLQKMCSKKMCSKKMCSKKMCTKKLCTKNCQKNYSTINLCKNDPKIQRKICPDFFFVLKFESLFSQNLFLSRGFSPCACTASRSSNG